MIKYICCDNSGENATFKNACDEDAFGIRFEMTVPNTPQKKSISERGFSMLCGRIRSMLNGAGIMGLMRSKLWAECTLTVMKLENLCNDSSNMNSGINVFDIEMPRFIKHLHMFGEIDIVDNRENIPQKLNDNGVFHT